MIRPRVVQLSPGAPPAPGVAARWAAVLRRRRGVGLGLFLSVAGLAAALVLLSRPVWRAEATLRLGAPASVGGVSLAGAGSPAGLFSLFQQMTGDPFANELELLGSRTVVEGVVEDNALHVEIRAPRGWHRDSLLVHLAAGRGTEDAAFEAERLPDGRTRVRRTSPTDSLVGDFAPGETARFGGIEAAFLPPREGMPGSFGIRTRPFAEAVERAGKRLRAERKRREANLVRIAYEDPDPGVALRVVASATARYAALRADLQRRESGQTTDSLRALAAETLEELRRAESALEGFQRSTLLVAPRAQSEALAERRVELAAALEGARAELARTDEALRRLDAASAGGTWVGLISHPTFLENQTLGELLAGLVELERERIALATRRTAEDRGARALEGQIAYMDASLRSLARQYREGVAEGVRTLEGRLAELEAALAGVPAQAIELGRRERALRQLTEVYLFTDQRMRQESLRDALSFGAVQMVDPPQLLFEPVWPRRKLGVAIGILLGLAFGTLGMAVVERADRSVRGAGELRELLGAPVLAVLALGAGGRVRVPARERGVLLRKRILLTPVDDASAAEAVAHALAPSAAPVPVPATGREEETAPGGEEPPVSVGPVLDRYAAAVELAEARGDGAEVVLVVRHGATSREEVRRAAALLGEAGARADGAVVVVEDAGEEGRAWW